MLHGTKQPQYTINLYLSSDDFKKLQPSVPLMLAAPSLCYTWQMAKCCHHRSRKTRKPRKVTFCNVTLWKRQTAIKEARLLREGLP